MSLWDANWATSHGVGKLTARAFNQLRSACVERTTAAGRSIPALLASDIPTNGRVRRVHRAALHNEVTALISAYVNHTDRSGNWNGQTTIPTWTEPTILSTIGDPARLPIPNDHINCALWNWQTKQILDLLRWGKLAVDMTSNSAEDNKLLEWTDGRSWSSAVSAFNALAFGNVTTGDRLGHYSGSNGTIGYIRRKRASYTWTNSTGFTAVSDFYYLFSVEGTGAKYYKNNDYNSTAENTYDKTESAVSVANSASHKFWVGNINNATVSDPMTNPIEHVWGWDADLSIINGVPVWGATLIAKFDGPGGFGYLDS